MTLPAKLAQLQLTLRIQQCMIELWQLRVKNTKLKIAQIQRDNKKLNNSGKKS